MWFAPRTELASDRGQQREDSSRVRSSDACGLNVLVPDPRNQAAWASERCMRMCMTEVCLGLCVVAVGDEEVESAGCPMCYHYGQG